MTRLSDVAAALGVSVATVSNAFTGRGRMKAETRRAICQQAEQMGYRWKERARAGAEGCIVLTEEVDSPFMAHMLGGLYAQAAELGLQLPVYSLDLRDEKDNCNPDVATLNRQARQVLAAHGRRVSGMIYLSKYARRIEGLLPEADFPLVPAFCTRGAGLPYVHYDDQQGAYTAVSALIRGGCRRIAMLSGPIDSIGMYYRTTGYQRALIDNGLSCDPALMRVGDWNQNSGYALTSALLREDRGIDAIFAQNDHMAVGALDALRAHGKRVPADVSLVGFDNLPESACVRPSLSTIEPPFAQMGRQSLLLLNKLLSGQADAQSGVLLPCRFVARESTNPILQ